MQKKLAKKGSIKCFGGARKINLVDLQKGRQNFRSAPAEGEGIMASSSGLDLGGGGGERTLLPPSEIRPPADQKGPHFVLF